MLKCPLTFIFQIQISFEDRNSISQGAFLKDCLCFMKKVNMKHNYFLYLSLDDKFEHNLYQTSLKYLEF